MAVHDWRVHGYIIDGFLGTWMKFLENGWRNEGFLFLFFERKKLKGKSQVYPSIGKTPQSHQITKKIKQRGVSHCGLAIYIKKSLLKNNNNNNNKIMEIQIFHHTKM
jgi:hypothetical protein